MAVLFDLDGTLFDTSYDIHSAVNQLLAEYNKPPMSYAEVRALISQGTKGILGSRISNAQSYTPRVLEICIRDGFKNTKPFPGIDQLLDTLDKMQINWGIVTNRIAALTTPVLAAAGYLERAKCIVCGDTTDKLKPDPKPLLHACTLLNVDPSVCVYVGDAITDIQAGKAAGMQTVAAEFGFINDDFPINTWQADYIAQQPVDILPWIEQWAQRKN